VTREEFVSFAFYLLLVLTAIGFVFSLPLLKGLVIYARVALHASEVTSQELERPSLGVAFFLFCVSELALFAMRRDAGPAGEPRVQWRRRAIAWPALVFCESSNCPTQEEGWFCY
jgi:hypothetical protein